MPRKQAALVCPWRLGGFWVLTSVLKGAGSETFWPACCCDKFFFALTPFVNSLDLLVDTAENHRTGWEEIYGFTGCHRMVVGKANLAAAKEGLLAKGYKNDVVSEAYERSVSEWDEKWQNLCDTELPGKEALYYRESSENPETLPNWRFRPR